MLRPRSVGKLNANAAVWTLYSPIRSVRVPPFNSSLLHRNVTRPCTATRQQRQMKFLWWKEIWSWTWRRSTRGGCSDATSARASEACCPPTTSDPCEPSCRVSTNNNNNNKASLNLTKRNLLHLFLKNFWPVLLRLFFSSIRTVVLLWILEIEIIQGERWW